MDFEDDYQSINRLNREPADVEISTLCGLDDQGEPLGRKEAFTVWTVISLAVAGLCFVVFKLIQLTYHEFFSRMN